MKTKSPWIPALVIVGVLLLITVVIIRPQTLPAPQPKAGQTVVVGGDEAELRVALARFLDIRAPLNSTRREVLWVGQLPPDMDIDVPVPPGARVVGSRVGVSPKSVWIILDSSQSQDELAALYTDFFKQQGFILQDVNSYMSGPIEPDVEASITGFCRASDSKFANLIVEPGEDVPTTAAILVSESPWECPLSPGENYYETTYALIPELHHPPTAWLNDTTGSADSADEDRAASSVGINVKMSPADLVEFYGPQLEAAGWKFTTVSASEYGAWSVWSLKDGDGKAWTGSLIIVASPVSDRKIITINVERK